MNKLNLFIMGIEDVIRWYEPQTKEEEYLLKIITEFHHRSDEVIQMEDEISHLESKVSGKDEEIEGLEFDLEDLRKENYKLEGTIQQLESDIENLKSALEAANLEIDGLIDLISE